MFVVVVVLGGLGDIVYCVYLGILMVVFYVVGGVVFVM